jgi:hypothetical protein
MQGSNVEEYSSLMDCLVLIGRRKIFLLLLYFFSDKLD